MIGDHVKLTQKCVSPRFFFSRFSEGLITFQNLLNRSTVASLQTSQVAYEQALRVALAAGREKKGELARLWNLILHRKSRCEMLIGGDDISNDVIALGTCFSRSFPLCADWRKSDSSVEGEPQRILKAEFKSQKRSCKLSFLFPPRRQSASESLPSACKQQFTVCHFYKPGKYL